MKKDRKLDAIAPIDSARPDDTHRQLMHNNTIGDQSARLTTIAHHGADSQRAADVNDTGIEMG